MAKNNVASPDIQDKKRRVRKILVPLRKGIPKKEQAENAAPFLDTLIAIILSQNTSDVNSHKAYQALRTTYPAWEDVAHANPKELTETIRVGGLPAQKATAIQGTLHACLERWDDLSLPGIETVPDNELIDFLTTVKGVGLKSATCAMMFALDRDLCAVDTHLHRVLNRLGLVQTSTPDKTFRQLAPLIPKGKAKELHVGLIHFGRDICKARLPHCFECSLYDLCEWAEKEAHASAKKHGPKAVSGDFLITDGI